MPSQYPPHFRRDMVNRMLTGESVLCLVQETSVPEQTFHRCRRVQAALRIERDLKVNHKVVAKVMADLGLAGLPRKKRRKRNLIGVRTMNRPGFVGDFILWKRGWSHGQKRENWATVFA